MDSGGDHVGDDGIGLGGEEGVEGGTGKVERWDEWDGLVPSL